MSVPPATSELCCTELSPASVCRNFPQTQGTALPVSTQTLLAQRSDDTMKMAKLQGSEELFLLNV